jgi:glycerol-3-phosphate acyltransferase PlsY
VATAAGALAVVGPKVWPVLLVVFLVAAGISRMVSVGSIAVAVAFPIACWLIYPERVALLLLSLVMSGFVLWRHRSNMRRIAAGEETKISFRRRLWGRQTPPDDGSA